ncbi:hypothetical protein [Crenothrix sp.]|uniref:hypothetical protein n=1 Tax=Crenothrix sp. TaxID=3100433 RepID=UPI00374D389F
MARRLCGGTRCQLADGHGLPMHLTSQGVFMVAWKMSHRLLYGQQQAIGIAPDRAIDSWHPQKAKSLSATH